jgi:hypothetical protein
VSDTRYDSRIDWKWQVSCEELDGMRTTEVHHQASPDSHKIDSKYQLKNGQIDLGELTIFLDHEQGAFSLFSART